MPLFNYKARNKMGQEILGTLDVKEEAAVIKTLKESGCSIISIKEVSQLKLGAENFLAKIWKVKEQELLFFVRQFSTLLKSGTPLTSAIDSISQQTKNKTMKEMLDKVKHDIESGISLSESFSRCPEVFSEYFVSMISVGETGGILGDVMDRLTHLLAQEIEIRSKIKAAMIYPIILLVVTVVIITFLLAGIIPKFVIIFETYGAKLPLATRILLAISLLVRKGWHLSLITLFVFMLWLKRYLRSEKGRYNFDSFLFGVPLFGPMYLKVLVAQSFRTLASLLKSGVTLMEAFRVIEKTVSNTKLRSSLQNISSGASKGQELSGLFKKEVIFPPMVIQMLSIGEKTGKLEQMLFDVADFYDQDIDYTIRNMTAVLEPILLLVMGSMVAFIALSVLLPIFNLVKIFRY